ncbi:uncharacterized protein EV154DRAFT_485188 [Mucor mucedo]|uniref:uncharacterized protein n=1 Tax=Mucor mucedo TaxID=29922 RepID=UPI00221FE9DF|nr:uncharacterized protein EV154DRAFT_485188 [Mucor mucedo]KAI7886230.1 hypothetical protein EV154DRAFT_485188 [Mucor mucedo]
MSNNSVPSTLNNDDNGLNNPTSIPVLQQKANIFQAFSLMFIPNRTWRETNLSSFQLLSKSKKELSAVQHVKERSEGGLHPGRFQLCCGLGKDKVTLIHRTPGLISNIIFYHFELNTCPLQLTVKRDQTLLSQHDFNWAMHYVALTSLCDEDIVKHFGRHHVLMTMGIKPSLLSFTIFSSALHIMHSPFACAYKFSPLNSRHDKFVWRYVREANHLMCRASNNVLIGLTQRLDKSSWSLKYGILTEAIGLFQGQISESVYTNSTSASELKADYCIVFKQSDFQSSVKNTLQYFKGVLSPVQV